MLQHPYRPWGPLNWVLRQLRMTVPWTLVGVCSPEDRCLATLQHLGGAVASARLVAIVDPDPADLHLLTNRLEARRREFLALGVPENNITTVDLLAPLDAIRAQLDAVIGQSTNVVVDISAMPKRWFFPIMKFLLQDRNIQTLVVTYASAVAYGDTLAENPDLVRALPGFPSSGASTFDDLIVGIGFEPLGLTSLVTQVQAERMCLLFPFPPGPPAYARNWMFVKQIEDMTDKYEIRAADRVHVHMYDCPQVFSALCGLTDDAERRAALAPYGPKTVSLAMCLFALAAERAGRPTVPVYYAQPNRYALDYSTGIRVIGAMPDITAYCVRFNGRELYAI